MTIKSKAFKFLLGIALVVGLGLALNSASAYDFGAATLRVGSRGADVMEVQRVVGVEDDGVFGPMTEAAVKAWQLNNGITPVDGIVGSITKAAMSSSPLLGTFPAGCTSNEGFSSTTGLSCAVVVGTLPAGCTSTVGFSPTTGQSCSVVTTLPAGCTSTVGYSSTTGAKCDGGSTPGTTGPLVGGEGDITVSDFTSGTETTIGEGKSEKVLGVKVSADDGSDVAINTMKIVIDQPNVDAGESTRLERYIEGVNIYMDSTKVGSVDVSDFSKSGTVYTKSVSLSNAVVRRDANAKFYVEVEAKSDISSELLDNTWKLGLTSVRFTDAMGVVNTITVDTSDVALITFEFESATANDKITSLSSSNNPDATTLLVKDDGTSDEYLVLAFKLKADKNSSDLNVLGMRINADPVTGGLTADDVVSDIYLKVGSTVYDDYGLVGDNYTFTIDEGDLTIEGGETIEVKVYATFNKEGLGTTYNTGEKITFKMVAANLDVENVDGDSITNSATDRSGNVMTLSTSEATVGEYRWTVSSTGTMVDFFFTVDNSDGTEAFDVVTADVNDAIAAGSTAVVVEGDTYVTDIKGTVTKYSGDDVVATPSTKYTVAAGDSTTFRVRYSLGTGATNPVVSADNGKWLEIKITSVAGETVPDNKVTSPTATVNL